MTSSRSNTLTPVDSVFARKAQPTRIFVQTKSINKRILYAFLIFSLSITSCISLKINDFLHYTNRALQNFTRGLNISKEEGASFLEDEASNQPNVPKIEQPSIPGDVKKEMYQNKDYEAIAWPINGPDYGYYDIHLVLHPTRGDVNVDHIEIGEHRCLKTDLSMSNKSIKSTGALADVNIEYSDEGERTLPNNGKTSAIVGSEAETSFMQDADFMKEIYGDSENAQTKEDELKEYNSLTQWVEQMASSSINRMNNNSNGKTNKVDKNIKLNNKASKSHIWTCTVPPKKEYIQSVTSLSIRAILNDNSYVEVSKPFSFLSSVPQNVKIPGSREPIKIVMLSQSSYWGSANIGKLIGVSQPLSQDVFYVSPTVDGFNTSTDPSENSKAFKNRMVVARTDSVNGWKEDSFTVYWMYFPPTKSTGLLCSSLQQGNIIIPPSISNKRSITIQFDNGSLSKPPLLLIVVEQGAFELLFGIDKPILVASIGTISETKFNINIARIDKRTGYGDVNISDEANNENSPPPAQDEDKSIILRPSRIWWMVIPSDSVHGSIITQSDTPITTIDIQFPKTGPSFDSAPYIFSTMSADSADKCVFTTTVRDVTMEKFTITIQRLDETLYGWNTEASDFTCKKSRLMWMAVSTTGNPYNSNSS
eukprot:GHVL01013680.1.p1 GENE.GHVL01013680.1~~GHVL01013680.1.p1  ORF type:complete len:649 (+),score=121.49 GHVL01013680.1:184-2130(+)